MKHGSLFSGIGGFDLASQWMGWENVFHCEINEFCNKILNYYWPNAKQHTDIKSTDFSIYRGSIDILTGGFPCQPYSVAGKRKGKEDERHLWPEMLRAIREIQPRWIVGENVRGIINWSDGLVFEEVCSDLENVGYEILPFLLPACGVNAPHRRDRIWFIAYSNYKGRSTEFGEIQETNGEISLWNNDAESCNSNDGNATDSYSNGLQGYLRTKQNDKQGWNKQRKFVEMSADKIGQISPRKWESFPTVSPICSRDDGFSNKLDGITFSKWRTESIKGYGNAIVPQVVLQIFKAIEQYESINN